MNERIDAALPNLRASLGDSPVADEALAAQISQLEVLRAGEQDPTIRVETLADLPESPVSPRPLLSIAGGLLAGLDPRHRGGVRDPGARPAAAP